MQESFNPATSEQDFRDRLSAALQRRVGPQPRMSYKQLAYNIQVSEQTVWGWVNATSAPRGWQLMKLLQFFDAAFANQIMGAAGCTVIKLDERRRQEVLDALAVLARAAG